MTDRTNEAPPAAVSDGAKQAGEIWQRWSWVERTVWTERMLTALEQGVKGGKWFSLMDKVTDPKTLWRGFEQGKANQGAAGVDRQSVEDFERQLRKFRDTIRVKTRRTNGHSLKVIVEDLNRTLKGWFGYFKHSYPTTFRTEDGWVRGRLRSILRKRSGRRGRACGKDHHRWPKAFFAEQGLFSLTHAHAVAGQSLTR